LVVDLVLSEKVFDMKAMGCQSLFESNLVSMAWVATFDASDLIWNGFD
jgi:hypothetical protein